MDKEEITSFCRQFFILSTFLSCGFNAGVMVAYPGVLNDDLVSPNCTEGVRASEEEIGWIASSTGITGAIGLVILPIIMDKYGRKSVNFVLNSFLFVGWIFIVFANNVNWLIIGRCLQGIKIGSVIIAVITVGEYVHPSRRGYFNVLKLVAVSLGIISCHVLSIFYTWRYIAVFSLFPSFYAVASVMFWPESPPYLAMIGKFAECEKTYVWLNGKYSKNNKELVKLLEVQKLKQRNREKFCKNSKIIVFLKSVISKDLIKPVLIVILLAFVQESSGKHYFTVYIIQIMKELVGNGSSSLAVYYSLAVDVMMNFATLSSVILVKTVRRRILLISSGATATVLMSIIGSLMILKSEYRIFENMKLLMPAIIIIYIFIINVGLLPLCFTLQGEVFPLEFRALGSCVSGFSMSVLYSIILRYLPLVIASGNLGIIYFIFSIVMLLSFVSLYFLLPETKDKTLQDIEFDITGKKIVFAETIPIISDNKS